MGGKEHEIQQRILLKIGSMPNVRVWRNNTGSIKSEDGRFITFGLKGSADILGILKGGRFLAIEVKGVTGRQSEQQKNFENMIKSFGGVYILARNIDDAIRGIQDAGTDLAE